MHSLLVCPQLKDGLVLNRLSSVSLAMLTLCFLLVTLVARHFLSVFCKKKKSRKVTVECGVYVLHSVVKRGLPVVDRMN